MWRQLILVSLLFHNHFAAYYLQFYGCTIKGDIISPPVNPLLGPGKHQEFVFSGDSLVSGNCTYYISALDQFVDFQWFYNSDSGHEYYGITYNPNYYNAFLMIRENRTHYFIFDL